MTEYTYRSAEDTYVHGYIAEKVLRQLRMLHSVHLVLDAGCGNGSLAARIANEGFAVSAFDISRSGIEQGRQTFTNVRFEVASVYDDLSAIFGQPFDACVSTEVIEHVPDPRLCVRRIADALRPGGVLILTTPYHGYFKNLALALSGNMDTHFTASWDGGHVKFWSRRTLSMLLAEFGLQVIGFEGAGRVPYLWKSMIVVARKC